MSAASGVIILQNSENECFARSQSAIKTCHGVALLDISNEIMNENKSISMKRPPSDDEDIGISEVKKVKLEEEKIEAASNGNCLESCINEKGDLAKTENTLDSADISNSVVNKSDLNGDDVSKTEHNGVVGSKSNGDVQTLDNNKHNGSEPLSNDSSKNDCCDMTNVNSTNDKTATIHSETDDCIISEKTEQSIVVESESSADPETIVPVDGTHDISVNAPSSITSNLVENTEHDEESNNDSSLNKLDSEDKSNEVELLEPSEKTVESIELDDSDNIDDTMDEKGDVAKTENTLESADISKSELLKKDSNNAEAKEVEDKITVEDQGSNNVEEVKSEDLKNIEKEVPNKEIDSLSNNTKECLDNQSNSENVKPIDMDTTENEESSSAIDKDTTKTEEFSSAIDKDTTKTEESSSAIDKDTRKTEESSNAIDKDTTKTEESSSAIDKDTSKTEESSSAIDKDTTKTEESSSAIDKDTTKTEESSSAIDKDTTKTEESSSAIDKDTTKTEDSSSAIAKDTKKYEKNSSAIDNDTTRTEKSSCAIEPITVLNDDKIVKEESPKPCETTAIPTVEKDPSSIVQTNGEVENKGSDVPLLTKKELKTNDDTADESKEDDSDAPSQTLNETDLKEDKPAAACDNLDLDIELVKESTNKNDENEKPNETTKEPNEHIQPSDKSKESIDDIPSETLHKSEFDKEPCSKPNENALESDAQHMEEDLSKQNDKTEERTKDTESIQEGSKEPELGESASVETCAVDLEDDEEDTTNNLVIDEKTEDSDVELIEDDIGEKEKQPKEKETIESKSVPEDIVMDVDDTAANVSSDVTMPEVVTPAALDADVTDKEKTDTESSKKKTDDDDEIIFIKECKKASDCTCIMCYKSDGQKEKDNSNEAVDKDKEGKNKQEKDDAVKDKEGKEKVDAVKDKEEKEKVDAVKKLKVNEKFEQLTRKGLEKLITKLFVKHFAYESETGKLRKLLEETQAENLAIKAACTSQAKQIKELVHIHEKTLRQIDDFKAERTTENALIPVKITRSVGLQVNVAPEKPRVLPAASPLTTRGVALKRKRMTPPVPVVRPPATRSLPASPVQRTASPAPKGAVNRVVARSPAPGRPGPKPGFTAARKIVRGTSPGGAVSPGGGGLRILGPRLINSTAAARGAAPGPQRQPGPMGRVITRAASTPTRPAATTSSTSQSPQSMKPKAGGSVETIDIDDDEAPRNTVKMMRPNSAVTIRPGTVRLANQQATSSGSKPAGPGTSPRLYVPLSQGIKLRTSTGGTTTGNILTSVPNTSNPNSSTTTTYVLETSAGYIPFQTNNVRLNLRPNQAPVRINYQGHPAPVPPTPMTMDLPVEAAYRIVPAAPKLRVQLADAGRGIQLTWSLDSTPDMASIESYQLYAYQENKAAAISSNLWKNIGKLEALPLPMACTLTQFTAGHTYHFLVRAIDIYKRYSSFSNPGTIHLRN